MGLIPYPKYNILGLKHDILLDLAGGAGGRGTWGSLLEIDGEVCFDKNDPNYDSETVARRPPSICLEAYIFFILCFCLYDDYNTDWICRSHTS